MKMSNKMYDLLKKLAMIILPGLGALYFTIAGIWGLPFAEQVLGTIAAISTFLGVVLDASTRKYNKENEEV